MIYYVIIYYVIIYYVIIQYAIIYYVRVQCVVIVNTLFFTFMSLLFQLAEEILKKWSKMAAAQEHVPLERHMSALVMKSHTRFAFGEYFKDEKALVAFRKESDFVSDTVDF